MYFALPWIGNGFKGNWVYASVGFKTHFRSEAQWKIDETANFCWSGSFPGVPSLNLNTQGILKGLPKLMHAVSKIQKDGRRKWIMYSP